MQVRHLTREVGKLREELNQEMKRRERAISKAKYVAYIYEHSYSKNTSSNIKRY
jgi:hypothetical protein